MAKIIIDIDQNKKALKDAYTQYITDLQLIQNTISPTQAQRDWATKKLAEIQEKVANFVRSQIV